MILSNQLLASFTRRSILTAVGKSGDEGKDGQGADNERSDEESLHLGLIEERLDVLYNGHCV